MQVAVWDTYVTRKDGKVMEFFGNKMFFRTSCKCDRDREAREKERQKHEKEEKEK